MPESAGSQGGERAAEPEPDWQFHEAGAAHLLTGPEPFPKHLAGPFADIRRRDESRADFIQRRSAEDEERASYLERRTAWYEWARTALPEVAGSLLLVAIRREATTTSPLMTPDGQVIYWSGESPYFHAHIKELQIRLCVVSQSDAAWAVRTAAGLPDNSAAVALMSYALLLAAQCRPVAGPALHGALRELAASVPQRACLSAPERRKIKASLRRLLPEVPAEGPVDSSCIAANDGWSAVVLAELASWSATAPVNMLLAHLASAPGSKPGRTWTAAAADLLAAEEAQRLLRLVLQAMATATGAPGPMQYFAEVNLLLSEDNADLVTAAAWAAAVAGGEWVVPALLATARRGIHDDGDTGYVASAKVPNAAIRSLGVIATPEAIAALRDLQRATRHAGFRKQISAALGAAASRAGLTPSQLLERVVPLASLDRDGVRLMTLGGALPGARVSIGSDLRVLTEWETASDRAPRRADNGNREMAAAVRAAVKEVRTTLAAERARLEGLLAADRQWAVAEWRSLYLDHPVTGALSRSLLWTIEPEPGTSQQAVTGIPDADGRLLTLGGQRPLPNAGTVRLWHPARADSDEVRGWRDHLAGAPFVQPFRQIFREVYPITPAELHTRMYSNRFASHVLRYRQTFALVKQRGWVTNYLGPDHGGNDGYARRDFPDAGVTAVFDHYAIHDDGGDVGTCSTDRVYFYRTTDRTRTPIPLEQVPDLVFSEAMRDVDLFVALTSIALDPLWSDRGDDPHLAYRHASCLAELSGTAMIRREALTRLLPKLAIAGRLELTDRHLQVRGQLQSYKIHIGSGNILTEPDNRYVCVVPARKARATVMLPFDDDPVLSVIISKAMLLAADDKISDPAIVSQLRPAPGG